MPRTQMPVKVSPHQGELLSGARPEPHFQVVPELEPEVAYGVSVSLAERNIALKSALTWLGRMAKSGAYREAGVLQAEGNRGPVVREMERRYSQPEFEDKLDASEDAKDGMEKALKGKLKTAYGYRQLTDAGEFPGITAEVNEARFRTGKVLIVNSHGKRLPPGHREGQKQFRARFEGSNNEPARDEYRKLLGRQATQIKKLDRKRIQKV